MKLRLMAVFMLADCSCIEYLAIVGGRMVSFEEELIVLWNLLF
jgi:hypothetical protein